jgi:hypothetical protein
VKVFRRLARWRLECKIAVANEPIGCMLAQDAKMEILDHTENARLYGTSTFGGSAEACVFYGGGCGTVYELSPQGGGNWTETTLYNFTGGSDGRYPESGVILDAVGNLYATSNGSGTACNDFSPCGNVFELSPQSGGGWVEKVLFNFNGSDGFAPIGSLVFDKAGNHYGTTYEGGIGGCNGGVGCGAVYELSPRSAGAWSQKVLYNFQNNGQDGAYLYSGLVFDAAGKLYGTASEGQAAPGDFLLQGRPGGQGSALADDPGAIMWLARIETSSAAAFSAYKSRPQLSPPPSRGNPVRYALGEDIPER